MTVSAFQGPLVVFGQAGGDYNPMLGPSLAWGGAGLFDPRAGYQPGQPETTPILGFSPGGAICAVDQVPSAINAANIAAAQVPTANTPLTLVSASGSGITVGASVVNIATGQTVTGLLVIDGAPANIAFGADGSVQIYDPRTAVARNIRITSAGNDSGATFKVVGFDWYGMAMSETIPGANAGVASGKKAFKFVQSVTPAGTLSGSNVSVGTGDVYGFPLRVDEFAFADLYWNSALITATTGFTAADTTNPATSTTGDVRGTYAVQSSSDGTKKLQVFAQVAPWNLAPVSGVYSGLFGMVQA